MSHPVPASSAKMHLDPSCLWGEQELPTLLGIPFLLWKPLLKLTELTPLCFKGTLSLTPDSESFRSRAPHGPADLSAWRTYQDGRPSVHGGGRVGLWKRKKHADSLLVVYILLLLLLFSHQVVSNSETPWTVARQAPLCMGFPRQKYCSGLPFPSPGDLPDPGIKPATPVSSVLAGRYFTLSHQGSPSLHIRIFLSNNNNTGGTLLAVRWLRLQASDTGGRGSIPGQENRSHVPQLRLETWYSQI